MAFYEKISEHTYRLTVCQGYDSKGKKLRKRKTIKLDKTLTPKQVEKELNRKMVMFEDEVLNGVYLDGEKITFAEFTQKWFEDYAEKNLALTTLQSYKIILNRILPAIGHIKLAKIQPHHLIQFYNNLTKEGVRLDGKFTPTNKLTKYLEPLTIAHMIKTTGISSKTCRRLKNGQATNYATAQKLCEVYKLDFYRMFKSESTNTLTTKTIRNHHIVIHSILSTAVDWNILMNNPAERAKPQKVTKPKAKYYNDEQVAEMLNALSSEPLMYMTMIYLAIDIGLREGELTGLKWEDINFNTCEISINKQRHYIAGIGDVEGKPKTDAGMRTVTASKTVISLLKEYKKQQAENRLKFGTAWQNGEYVFLHEDGKPISTQRPYKWFTNFLQRHNLPKITFHQLRHTNASLLISSGEDIVTVSGRLGHADKNVTLNTYSHIIKSKEAQVANKMDEFYAGLKIINC